MYVEYLTMEGEAKICFSDKLQAFIDEEKVSLKDLNLSLF